ncbi:MAG: threonylcarbamoyl-AMP synthase [Parcubacteria group bacterium]|nr:threonylcarbamoyl-AMP synthase [Parcubacteria group bacterium]
MKIIDRQEVESNKEAIIGSIRDGSIFVYPTDTIYGLGCNALLDDSVQRLREAKNRDEKPFSVIAPNKEWILEHCAVNREDVDAYLPGPYTLFVQAKRGTVSSLVNPGGDTLGVRIPKHWFADVIAAAGVPFVTTSVNVSGEPHMQKLEDLKEGMKEYIQYCVYEGENAGTSSTKIDLVSKA